MIPKLRESYLKVSSIMKRNPMSSMFYPRSFKDLAQAVKQNTKENPNLHDYGAPQQPSHMNSRGDDFRDRKPKPDHMRSMNHLPNNIFDDENEDLSNNEYDDLRKSVDGDTRPGPPKRNMLLSDKPFNKPNNSSSGDSKDSWKRLPTSSKMAIDWATTPIYEEYTDKGITKYNEGQHEGFYEEKEATEIFSLLKTRYSNTASSKSVEPFFHKAMDTLGEILGSFSHNHLFRAIQQMYTKADIQNTMKLILRVQGMFEARYTIFEIFHDILKFKKLSRNIEILLTSNGKQLIDKSYNLLSKSLDSLQEINTSLQDNFLVL